MADETRVLQAASPGPAGTASPSTDGFEHAWRRRFERAAQKHATDHAVSGWSEEGLRRRLATFQAAFRQDPPTPGVRVLDLGCGAGAYSAWLAEQGYRVIALDYSMATLERAALRIRNSVCRMPNDNTQRKPADRVRRERDGRGGTPPQTLNPKPHFLAGEAYALPLAAASLDAVVCVGVLQTLDAPRRCLAEIRRVLAPGGRLFISALNPHDLASTASRALRPRRAGYEDLRRHDLSLLRRWLREAGFQADRVHPVYLMPDRLAGLSRRIERRGGYRALARFGTAPLHVAHAVLVTAHVPDAARQAPPAASRPRVAPRTVALVAPFPPPAGGMAVQANRLAAGLESEGLRVIRVPFQTDRPTALRPLRNVRGVRSALTGALFLARLLPAVPKADLVHLLACSHLAHDLFTVPTVAACRFWRRPVIVNFRGGDAGPFFRRRPRALTWIRRGTRLTTPSGFLRDVFAQFGLAATVVPNIAELDRFRYRPRCSLGPHLLVTRHLEPWYNVTMAIRAFERVRASQPATTLTIVGDGRERPALESLVAQRRLAGVTFLGRVPNERMPEIYDRCDVALNPSNVDNMPISLLEAFASGLVVVSTSAGGVPYLVDDGRTGYLVPPDDADAMAERVLWLCAHPAEARETAARARAACDAYAWPEVWTALRRVYDDALGRAWRPPKPRPQGTRKARSRPGRRATGRGENGVAAE
jgi:glycosyltransferase involved in cell wall biosynthesis/SAM-dependent methyltransferase